MSQKLKKYIEFLKSPINYINNEKAICNAVNLLILETNKLMGSLDENSIHLINSNFPEIKQISCMNTIASLLGNTQFTDIAELAKILIAKYLYMINLMIPDEEDIATNKKDCTYIQSLVDNAIKNMSISDILTNKLFSDKPINYNVDASDKKNNLVSSFPLALPPLMVFEDRDLQVVTDRGTIIELFDQKKKFADEITKEMSGSFLFSDDKQDIINNFQYLINKMFNDMISEYIKLKGYKEDAVVFIYKGGTSMKIIYDKYKSILPQNNKIFNDYVKYFSRSDADYAIFINNSYFNTFDSYNQVLCDVNKISFNILERVQDILSNNLDCTCPLNNVTENNLMNLLASLNKILNNTERNTNLPDFKDVREFIGITFNNKDYFSKPIPTGLVDSKIHTLNISTKKSSLDNYDPNIVSKRQQLKDSGRINSVRDNFIIKIHGNNTFGKPNFSPAICKTNKSINTNGIYYYLNETNKFMTSNLLTEFNLHRLKINAVVYYVTNSGQYGYFNCPSELVDVSIGGFYDGKTKNMNFNKIIKKYKNKKVEFNSYTLYGFIDDLYKALFCEAKYPWEVSKYEKKVYRVIILLFIYINNKFNNTKVLYDTFSKFFTDLTNDTVGSMDTFELEEKNTSRYPLKNETLIYKLYSNILSRYHLIKSETIPNDEMKKFKEMIKIINELLVSFKPEDIISGYDNNIEDVPFMDKYLKYKTKYFALLKKLGRK